MFLSLRASAHTGVAIRPPVPAPAGAEPRHSEPVTDVTGVAIRPPVPAPAGAATPFYVLPPAVTFLSIAKER